MWLRGKRSGVLERWMTSIKKATLNWEVSQWDTAGPKLCFYPKQKGASFPLSLWEEKCLARNENVYIFNIIYHNHSIIIFSTSAQTHEILYQKLEQSSLEKYWSSQKMCRPVLKQQILLIDMDNRISFQEPNPPTKGNIPFLHKCFGKSHCAYHNWETDWTDFFILMRAKSRLIFCPWTV